jgi:hypothetical protein
MWLQHQAPLWHRASVIHTGVKALLAFSFVAACASEAPPPVTPSASPPASAAAAPPAVAAPTTPPGPGDWDAWSHDKKLVYMKAAVQPKMGAAFRDLDPAKYAAPKCTLCHVSGAKDTTFKMPDPGLPKLPSNPDDFKALSAKKPQMFDFMVKTVVPQMAGLIGEPPYDPAKQAGFGCFGCHTKS